MLFNQSEGRLGAISSSHLENLWGRKMVQQRSPIKASNSSTPSCSSRAMSILDWPWNRHRNWWTNWPMRWSNAKGISNNSFNLQLLYKYCFLFSLLCTNHFLIKITIKWTIKSLVAHTNKMQGNTRKRYNGGVLSLRSWELQIKHQYLVDLLELIWA